MSKLKQVIKIYDDTKEYYNDKNLLHREDGPAVIYNDGTKIWYINGLRHRENGPAVIWKDSEKIWYINDKYHRLDGPAIIYANGTKFWYINGTKYTEDKFDIKIAEINKKESCCSADVNVCPNCGTKLKK